MIDKKPFPVPKEILFKIHKQLVDWAEQQGFSWIDVAVYHFPCCLVMLTVKDSTYPHLSMRIMISNQELGHFLEVGQESTLFEKFIPGKVEAYLEDFLRRKNILVMEEKELEQKLSKERSTG